MKTRRIAAIDVRPQGLRWLWLWRAFRELSTCRAVGMTLGRIPIVAMHEYVDRYGLPEWCVDALLKIDVGWLTMEQDDGG